ncbi:ABC transporter ATP-binding protein [Streptomyces sp. AN091965]|uniref:ABC transporter ATP-binding protein n=1 Tax=Streptomyces sp. AN091965 TaxID=2927803 RepID=UPI001F6084DC|nr:ABC transporter ATP-binding protein [Streptomyces sp. AN091965]MCI3934519.1 ABC transporter ATP-binding protein/permease [Streptomyces sp. AN091965]
MAAPGDRMSRSWQRALALLWGIGRSQVLVLTAVTALGAVVPALQVHLTARTVQHVADSFGGTGAAEQGPALLSGGCLVALSVVGHFLGVLRTYQETLLRNRLSDAVTLLLMEKAAGLSLQQFEDAETYDALQRATREATFRPYQAFTGFASVVSSLLSFLSVGAVLLHNDIPLALALCLAPVPSALVGLAFSRRTHAVQNARAEDRRKLIYLEHLLTNDQTYKETRLLDLAPLLLSRSKALVDEFYSVDQDIERRQALATALAGLVSTLVTGGAVLLAVHTALRTGQVGALAGYITGIALIQTSVQTLFASATQLYENNLFLGNLFAFIDLPSESVTQGHRVLPERLRQGIEFRQVSFTYPGSAEPVLEDVSFTVPAGTCVALVGSNGAGKSTLLKLLARFYEPTSGTILVDGRPLAEYDLAELRNGIGAIFQDYIQYEAPARENIGLGRAGRLDDEQGIRAAADHGRALGFLDELPQGLDTYLGRWFTGGRQLSGGQWQKVALARAFFREAPVMLLDEPTAAVDAAAEAEIFGLLRKVHEGSTSLLVAHRFSAVRTADHIVVIDAGRVREQGSHDDLMTSQGLYARLFRLQASGYQ